MATLRDVAERAGVTVTTVSRMLNGRVNVSGKTRNKIEAAMRELGYEPWEPHRCVIHTDTVSFRAKYVRSVRQERKKHRPEKPVDIEMIRRAWRINAGIHTKEMHENV